VRLVAIGWLMAVMSWATSTGDGSGGAAPWAASQGGVSQSDRNRFAAMLLGSVTHVAPRSPQNPWGAVKKFNVVYL